jgi:hypothetical protein
MVVTNSFFCESIRQREGRFDVIGFIDEVVVREVPAQLQSHLGIMFVSVWHDVSAKQRVTLEVISPSGVQETFEAPSIDGLFETVILQVRIGGYTFKEPGDHFFRVVSGSVASNRVRLSVKLVGSRESLLA